ncbi:MAG: hypothetical protein Q8M03_17205 [Legionella sp.]|nr:hypothetical protein [Legionella sp.]
MFLVHNEQVKLTATWLNTLATAIVAAGVFAPMAALLYQVTPFVLDARTSFAVGFGCFALGGGLHLLGRALLRRLRE